MIAITLRRPSRLLSPVALLAAFAGLSRCAGKIRYPSYSGEVVWREVSSKSARMDEHSMPGIVAEMSRAVDNAVARLASSLQDHVAPASASRRGTN